MTRESRCLASHLFLVSNSSTALNDAALEKLHRQHFASKPWVHSEEP